MKISRFLILLGIVSLLGEQSLLAQEEKDEKSQQIKATITFITRSDDDSYEFRVPIYPNGTASVFVQPDNGQNFIFQGNIVLP